MVRNSMRFVRWKDYKPVAAALKTIYQSATEDEALQALERFGENWDEKYLCVNLSLDSSCVG